MADVPSISERKVVVKKEKAVKKKTRNPEEWHKQKQKRLRIAGKEHTSTNGRIVPARQPGTDCNCKRKCFQKVPEEVRLKTFQGFYSMKTHDEQNAYLFGLMRQIDIKRKRVKNSTRRTCTFEYFVRVRGRETQVCQTAFKNIHAITERKVRVLCKKMDDGIMFPSDNRGKNSTNRTGIVRLAPEIIKQIKVHIFNIVHTHKLKDFIRLDKVSGLEINIAKMWKDYVKTYDSENFAYTTRNGLPSIAKPQQPNNMVEQKQALQSFQIQAPESYAPIYPGSGHLINLAENYFQTQYCYQQGNQSNMNTVNYYPVTVTSSGQTIENTGDANAQNCNVGGVPTILMYTSIEPEVTLRLEDSAENKRPSKVQKKRGPVVKQWRYTNIFHEEINGVALSAIKTRLGMYYSESEVAKKKNNNKTQPEHSNIMQHNVQTENVPTNHSPTIAIINIHPNGHVESAVSVGHPPPLAHPPRLPQHTHTLHQL